MAGQTLQTILKTSINVLFKDWLAEQLRLGIVLKRGAINWNI